MVFEHIMREKATGRVLVQCSAKVVFVDVQGRPKRLPEEYVEKLA
jgi:acyl-CoA thioesterase FadM